MFSKNDRKMLESINSKYDSINSKYDLCNYSLKKRCDDLWDRVTKAEGENFSLRTKVDLYEKFIETLTNATNTSNDVYMFDGEIYKLTERTIYEKAGMPKTMSADFECMTGFTKKFKEE